MTEDEAKTKWCPFVHVFNYQINGNNAFGNNMGESVNERDGTIGVHCIGSQCMVWRVKHIVTDVHHDGAGNTSTYSDGSTGGYCGLAGG
jgi:hypothetical protein